MRTDRGKVVWSVCMLLFVAQFLGCAEKASETDGLYLMMADAVDPEAYQGRQRVVNPLFLAEGNPSIPGRILTAFEEQGFEILTGTGDEDSSKATLLFSPSRLTEDGGYEVRLFVSLGARPGTLDRGDSWWRAVARCDEGCEITEVLKADNRSWY